MIVDENFYRIDSTAEGASCQIKDTLIALIKKNPFPPKELVVLCIGTDRSTGDALGPLIGTWLNNKRLNGVRVLGNLENPLHAVNLEETLRRLIINDKTQRIVIAVDACLGKYENVGWITVRPGPLKPGAGVNKKLPPVGEISIHGVVNVGGFLEYLVLQSTRLSLVIRMAEVIGEGILLAAQECSQLSY